ncbi:hypothetical protein KAN02_06810 [Acinetobacter nosocomialis]|uniref:hypothetical protein n=1 Tax=Acinetobacter nosocomialis TaxID=106654 RepID=UPI00102ED5EB|nr:hypothetical protein [Acinetobacter nosocomialis]QBF77787.1 hypothetical protein KAN02_06810 [Acinetobacter nosocomialis]
MEQYAIDLLYDDLGSGLLPEDLDYEDIPEEHLNKIRLLLDSQDKYSVFQAAKLLTFWGMILVLINWKNYFMTKN